MKIIHTKNTPAKAEYFTSESQRKHTSRLSFIYGSKQLVTVAAVLVLVSLVTGGVIIQKSRDSKAAALQIVTNATADTYISKPIPDRTLNQEKDLWVRGGTTRTTLSYIRFNVSGLGSSSVSTATLRLYHLDNPGASGGKVYRINWDWAYNPTWNHNPGIPSASSAVGDVGAVSRSNSYYDVKLNTAGWKDGVVTIVLMSDLDDGVNYSSSQGGHAPQLVLSMGGTSGGGTTTTPPPSPEVIPIPAPGPPNPVPTPTPAPTPNPTPISGDLFSNPWPQAAIRTPIPSGEPNITNSAAMVQAFLGTGKSVGGSNSPTRFLGKPGDPVQYFAGQPLYTPSGASPSNGADRTMEVFNYTAPDGKKNVAGRRYIDTIYGGNYQGAAYFDRDGSVFGGNGTAWGLFSSVGVMLHEELAAGVIPHSIGVAMGTNILAKGKYMAPAHGQESKATGSTVPMGARFQITKSWPEIESILSSTYSGDTLKYALIYWRAIHDYGYVVRDGTGNNGLWIYADAQGMPSNVNFSTIARTPGLQNASDWRVPARSAY